MSPVLDRVITPEDLLKRVDEGQFELVNGLLVERRTGILGGL